MLGTLEARLAAVVSDGVSSRAHLTVGIAPLGQPGVGKGDVIVALSSFVPETGFVPHTSHALGAPAAPQSRRILPLRFDMLIQFRMRPASASETARADARTLLLEDMSAVAYLLAEPSLQNGTGLAAADPDPGFRVLSFALASATAPADVTDGCYAGQLVMRGDAQVWPAGVATDEGVIETIDRVIEPLPIAFRTAHATVRPGMSTTMTAVLGSLWRLVDAANGQRGPADLALAVLADVPLPLRGTIGMGTAGAETGVRIVPASPEVAIAYTAPAGNPGPAGRLEYVAVHLATPDGRKGVYLGAVPIQLVPAP